MLLLAEGAPLIGRMSYWQNDGPTSVIFVDEETESSENHFIATVHLTIQDFCLWKHKNSS